MLPFLIEDTTPRALRVPGAAATEHPNGARGVSRLLLAVRDAAGARASLAALAGSQAPGGTPRLGRHKLALLAPDGPGAEDAKRRLEALGPGPLAVELGAARDEDLPPNLARGARIALRRT